jgi:hypothetical protein
MRNELIRGSAFRRSKTDGRFLHSGLATKVSTEGRQGRKEMEEERER